MLALSFAVILGMVIYIWKRRRNRFKFKKDEIFDEILDRGHLESDDNMAEASVMNDSMSEDNNSCYEDTPESGVTQQIIAINI